MNPTIVLGTTNSGKANETLRFLSDLPVSWKRLDELELNVDVVEDGETFEVNAIKKATTYAAATKLPTLAGDSGLEVPALNGWPGVRSRRLDGDRHLTDDEVIGLFSERLSSLPPRDRRYRFVTVFALALPSGDVHVGKGEHSGELTLELHPMQPRGLPFRRFWKIPQFDKYFLDLTQDEYNQINHNKQALDALRPAIEEYLEQHHA